MKKLFTITLLSLLSIFAVGQTQIQMPMPNQTGTFTGNVRGYYFTAPSCFTITGAEIPTTASSAAQNVAIVRFQTTPPTYSTTTNAFTTLLLVQNGPTSGIIPCNIQVETGDIIGVLASRGTVNSYSSTGNTTTIEGFSVPLTRLGMQFQLPTNPPQQLWTEAAANISRCWLYYDSLLTFNITATPGGPNQYSFTDGSDSSFTSVWNYGDGSPLDTTWNPTHTYSVGGTFNVCSYITTSCGTDTVCTTVTVCGADPVANFGYWDSLGVVSFYDSTTNASSWFWDFGDGGTDTLQNPTHTYSAPGNYNVCLISTNSCAVSDTICMQVSVCFAPVAGYDAQNQGPGAFQFVDLTTNQPVSWAWDFGDGATSTSQNPFHQYAVNGIYTVCLISTNACGVDTTCTQVTACIDFPGASFVMNASGGTVTFADSSVNTTSWAWDFGDGSTDSVQNPTHTYASNGMYSVCLVATNMCGSDTLCDSITVCPEALTAAFTSSHVNLTYSFTSTGTGEAGYLWDFGDGGTATTANPSHTYAADGDYNVCLTTWNICGDSTQTCDSTFALAVMSPGSGTEITFYPNPFSETAEFLVKAPGNSAFTLKINDLRGVEVLSLEGRFNEAISVSRNGMADGVYMYQVIQGNTILGAGKMVVNR